jgi:hypothetical protein
MSSPYAEHESKPVDTRPPQTTIGGSVPPPPPGNGQEGLDTGDEQSTASATVQEAKRTGSAATEEGKALVGTAAEGAKQVAAEAGEQAKQVVNEVGSQVSALAAQAREQVVFQAEAQSQRAAANLRTLSQQAQALSEGRAQEAGPLPDQVRQLATYLSKVSERMERRGLHGMLEDVSDFARRRPAAFVGLTAVTGFAVSRIGRSLSASSSTGGSTSVSQLPGATHADMRPYARDRSATGSQVPATAGPPASDDDSLIPGVAADIVVENDFIPFEEPLDPERRPRVLDLPEEPGGESAHPSGAGRP